MQSTNGTQHSATGTVVKVSEIDNSTWLYGVQSGVGAGQVSFSPSNPSSILNVNGDSILKWSIDVGQVADQSFAGRTYQKSEPKLFIGNGNYSSITGPDCSAYPNLCSITASSLYGTTYEL